MLRAVIKKNAPKSILAWGYTDFTGQYDPAIAEQLELKAANFEKGKPCTHYTVENGLPVLLSPAEISAVEIAESIAEKQAMKRAVELPIYDSVNDLPLPPKRPNTVVAIQNYSGRYALGLATNTGYLIFTTATSYP